MARKTTAKRHQPRFGIVISALLGALFTCAFSGAAYGAYLLNQYKLDQKPQHILIQYDPGGFIDDFAIDYAKSRKRGDFYKIDGPCISGCTFITGAIPVDHVCITPYARLGFHAAWIYDDKKKKTFADDGTSIEWQFFSPPVQEFLKAHGWESPNEDQPALIWMGFDDLKAIYKVCP